MKRGLIARSQGAEKTDRRFSAGVRKNGAPSGLPRVVRKAKNAKTGETKMRKTCDVFVSTC